MKIALSAMEPGLDSEINPRFGRSQYFVVVEPETMQMETFKNPYLDDPSGAGISAAQLICSKGAGAVITGNLGPKAHQVLSAAGVRILTGASGRVSDAIERFRQGEPMVDADCGMGSPTMRRGGRGMGMGTAMGRGMGRGLGRGRGRGIGTIPEREGDRSPFRNWDAEVRLDRGIKQDGQNELVLLKEQATRLAEELDRIQRRIERIENS